MKFYVSELMYDMCTKKNYYYRIDSMTILFYNNNPIWYVYVCFCATVLVLYSISSASNLK